MHHAGFTYLRFYTQCSSLLGLSFPGSLPRTFCLSLNTQLRKAPLRVHLTLGRQPQLCFLAPGNYYNSQNMRIAFICPGKMFNIV